MNLAVEGNDRVDGGTSVVSMSNRCNERSRKERFFKNIKEEIDEAIEEERHQEKMFSQLKDVQDVKKKAMIQWM
jgi:hypothetical protein